MGWFICFERFVEATHEVDQVSVRGNRYGRTVLDDALHLGPVGKPQFTAGGEGQQFLGKGPGQNLGLASQMTLELGESGELHSILEISRCIHFRSLTILYPSTLDEAIDLGVLGGYRGSGNDHEIHR